MVIERFRRLAYRCMRLADTCRDEEEAARLRLLAGDYLDKAAAFEPPPSQQQQQIQPDKKNR
jgi:hypothetical protein